MCKIAYVRNNENENISNLTAIIQEYTHKNGNQSEVRDSVRK